MVKKKRTIDVIPQKTALKPKHKHTDTNTCQGTSVVTPQTQLLRSQIHRHHPFQHQETNPSPSGLTQAIWNKEESFGLM